GVQQGDEAGPGAREVACQEQRAVLAGDAVAGVRPVGPVDEDADERVVEGAELADRLVGPGEVAGHDVGRPAELAQGVLQLLGGLLHLGPGPLVGFRAVVAGPEYADLFHGYTSLGPLGNGAGGLRPILAGRYREGKRFAAGLERGKR